MSKVKADDDAGATQDAPDIVEIQPPQPIKWLDALKAGWHDKEEPAKFYVREVLLGIIICMAQIPESIAFAYMARVRPPVALHAAWIMGVVCALIGGRPGMINGATGAFAAIVQTFLAEPEVDGGNGEGIELLFPSVMVGGVLMLGVWALRLDRFITMLPLPVMVGFCNGLAIVIGLSQLHPFQVPVCSNGTAADGGHRRHLAASGACTASGWKEGAELGWMLLICFLSMFIMEFLPKVPKPTKIMEKPAALRPFLGVIALLLELPSSLISIITAILIELLIESYGFVTPTIGSVNKFTQADAFPRPFFVEEGYDLSKINGAWGQIFQQGIILCAVGCIESLMTAEVVSSFTKTSHHPGLVVGAMGIGNLLSGFLGGMGGNAMIGLSTIACLNDGKGRVAPLATALGIFICVSAAYSVLNFIPMAALAGIMIVVVLHTFKWFSLPMIVSALLPETARMSTDDKAKEWEKTCKPLGCFTMRRKVVRSDVLVMLTVSILIAVIKNIVLAVAIGLGLSCAAFAWEAAHHLRVRYYYDTEPKSGDRVKVYEVDGPLFFAAAKQLSDSLTPESDPKRTVVVFNDGYLYDYTLMDSVVALTAAYQAVGKQIEFHRLHAKSARMITKAEYYTKQVSYTPQPVEEMMTSGGDASARSGLRNRRAYGISGPTWTDAPGPGAHGVATTSTDEPTVTATSSV